MTRRRALVVAVAILLGVAAAAARHGLQVAAIAIAYKAQMLCSGVFVSGRDARIVASGLDVDDLALLRYVATDVDLGERSATASAFGLITRRSIYRTGEGCALTPGDAAVSSASEPSSAHVPAPSRLPPNGPAPLANGGAPARLSVVLDRAFAEQSPSRLKRTLAVVVWHDGRVVAERYADGLHADTPLIGWSMTKSAMNALVGILVREGRLSRDAPAPLPEWRDPGDPRAGITVDHLLRMSSGLRFDEDMTNPLADVTRMLFAAPDMAAFASGKPLDAPPGTRWQYSSGSSMILARIVRNVMRDDAEYRAFPRRALFEPVGMPTAMLETDAAGTFVGASYMYASARDWAKFGVLYLQDGVWDGRRILPAGWVAYTRTPAPADPRAHYGAQFWLDVPDEYKGTGTSLPTDAYHAVGHEAQFVTVIPSRQAVIVRLGRTRYPDAWDHPAFVRDVLDALGEGRE